MGKSGTFWLPFSGSTIAPEVDAIFYFILYVSIFFFFLITIGTLYFSWKYRLRKGQALALTSGVAHNTALEIIWTVIPTIILLVIFFWGFQVFMKLTIVPKDAMQIKVTGQRWFWTFDYPDGINTTNELVVPVNKTVGLLMTSKDVIHSFFIPAFRTKYDVIPNRYTQQWFEAPQPGEYQVFCAEYCGTKHSEMLGKVRVLAAHDYEQWRDQAAVASLGGGMSAAAFGEKLYKGKGACFTCHSVDGSKVIGPTFKGVFGKQERFADGTQVKVDENYIRESLLEPMKKVTVGYPPVMPTYQGVLKDKEIDALIEYIKTVK